MINCIIIEDEPVQRKELEAFVNKTNILKLIGSYKTVDEAMEIVLDKKANINLMLVDIQLRNSSMNGFEFVQSLRNSPFVIFITSHIEYSLDSWRINNVIDFLKKGCEYKDFLNAVLKLYERLFPEINSSKLSNFLYIKDGATTYIMKYEDIMLIEGFGDYIRIHYLDYEGKYQILSPYLKLGNIMSVLSNNGFMQIHSSFIINENHILTFAENYEEVFFRFKNIPFKLNNQNYEKNIKEGWLPIGEKFRGRIKEKIHKKIVKRK